VGSSAEYQRAWWVKNKERVNANRRNLKTQHPERYAKLIEGRRRRWPQNREHHRQWHAQWRERNRESIRLRTRQWANAHYEERRTEQLSKKFQLSKETYQLLLNKQGGLCAICKRAEVAMDRRSGRVKALAVDHDHLTGRVRGLLCGSCNRGLGLFKEDTRLLELAVKYLNGFQLNGTDSKHPHLDRIPNIMREVE
jgi:recombination endonuclease VII